MRAWAVIRGAYLGAGGRGAGAARARLSGAAALGMLGRRWLNRSRWRPSSSASACRLPRRSCRSSPSSTASGSGSRLGAGRRSRGRRGGGDGARVRAPARARRSTTSPSSCRATASTLRSPGPRARRAAPRPRDGRCRLRLHELGRAGGLLPRPGRQHRGADRAPRASARAGATGRVRGGRAARRLRGRHRLRSAVARGRRSSASSGSRCGTAPSTGEARLAFVGEKARTLILCRAGRPWLPTGRPAEAHPVEVVLVAGRPEGERAARRAACRISRRAARGAAAVRASRSSRHDVEEAEMARPVTLFTGQWADLPLDDLAGEARRPGASTALELACWGDHFEVDRAVADPGYVKAQRELLERHGLGCWAIGAHLVGQAVCDPIDARHKGILPPEVWGDGDPEGVRQRAAERMKDTARAAAALRRRRSSTGSPARRSGTCSTRSRRTTSTRSSAATRSSPSAGGRSSTSSTPRASASRSRCTRPRSPTTSSRRARRSTRSADRPGFGINLDPSHFAHQFLDTAAFAIEFADRIYHVHVKDSRRFLDGRSSILGGHLNFGEPQRGWDFVSPGPRRRRLRGVLPGAEPDRLRGAALDRVGGLGHGPRVGGAGRARVRAPHRLRARRASPSTRRCSGRDRDAARLAVAAPTGAVRRGRHAR